MSYYPKKGMHLDPKTGMAIYNECNTPGEPGAGKRWYSGEVVRKAVNSKGEVVRKNKQQAEVFCEEGAAAAMIFRRCPDPGMGDGDIRVNLYFGPM